MMLAEASKPELLVKAFDVDYAFPLLSALNDVVMKGAPASRLRASWEESQREFPRDALHMRVSDDHDEARAVARFGLRGALAGSALMLTLDGVPLLYNGMEVGDATESGDPALFAKLPVFWSPKDRPPLRQIYRSLIELRKEYAPFQRGQPCHVQAPGREQRIRGGDQFVQPPCPRAGGSRKRRGLQTDAHCRSAGGAEPGFSGGSFGRI
jgi:hypothetical protein